MAQTKNYLIPDSPLKNYKKRELYDFAVDISTRSGTGELSPKLFVAGRNDCMLRAEELGVADLIEGIFAVYDSASSGVPVGVPPDYILETKNGGWRVDCAMLAEYIRNKKCFFEVENGASETANRFMYWDGVYVPMTTDSLSAFVMEQICRFSPSLLKTRDVQEVVKNLFMGAPTVKAEAVNGDEDIINFKNGLLRLSDMELLPHSASVYSTVRIDVDWDENARDCPVFTRFLDDLSGGDEAVKKLYLEYLGACISNVKGWRFKKALFQFGAGNTGKSQMKKLAEMIVGSGNICSGVGLETLETDRFATSMLYGKRLAGTADMSVVPIRALDTFKMLTGGDTIYAQRKGQPQFSFVYDGFLWFSMNTLPKFGGDHGDWVYERILALPCENVIPEERRDPQIAEKMYAERGAIIVLAVKALKEAVERGYKFTEPECCVLARWNYANANDTVRSFFAECCEMRDPDKAPDDGMTTAAVYNFFRRWCEDKNITAIPGKKTFRDKLSEITGREKEALIRKMTNNNYYIFTVTQKSIEDYK